MCSVTLLTKNWMIAFYRTAYVFDQRQQSLSVWDEKQGHGNHITLQIASSVLFSVPTLGLVLEQPATRTNNLISGTLLFLKNKNVMSYFKDQSRATKTWHLKLSWNVIEPTSTRQKLLHNPICFSGKWGWWFDVPNGMHTALMGNFKVIHWWWSKLHEITGQAKPS